MGPAEEDVLWQQLEEQFPVWNQAEMDGIKPEDSEEIYEDKFGLIMPKYLSNYIDCWKRPSQLVVKNPDVPMIVFDENENDVASRKVKGEMFAGNDRGLEWLVAVMMAIKDRTKVIQANDFLWELIYPKDKNGFPTVNPKGKYYVKCYFMKEWRCVEIDDRFPVDLFGRPLPVGIRPIQLWPLLLTKAMLKLMAAFGVLEKTAPCDVPAFTWLTAWATEAFEDTEEANTGGKLYDRLCEAKIDQNTIVTCCLEERAASDRPPPRMVILCGPSGVGIGQLVRQILDNYDDSFGRCVSHTTRPPMEHEEFGVSYNFVTDDRMKEMQADHQFLEFNTIETHSKIFPGTHQYATSLATVREIAAAGKLCITSIDLKGCQDLYNREGVDALYIFIQPPSVEDLERRLRLRLKEAEQTVQRRMDYAREECSKSSKAEIFDAQINTVVDEYETFYHKVKETISPLSPIIRNRIRGLPPYLLDYSDLIPSNSVEKPDVKPVFIAGPDDVIVDRVVSDLIREFEDVFGLALKYTTDAELAKESPQDLGDSDTDTSKEGKEGKGKGVNPYLVQRYEYITEEAFDEKVKSQEFVEHSSDLFKHQSLVKRHGISKDSMQSVLDKQRLCIVKTSVSGAQMIRKQGIDAMCIFLNPDDMDVHLSRLRKYLAEPEHAIQAMLKSASELHEAAKSAGIFDKFLTNDGGEKAYQQLKDCISQYRPDIIVPEEEESDDSGQERFQPPLIVCGPSGVGKAELIKQLIAEYPKKFEYSVSYTTRAPREGEQDGVEYHFVDAAAMQDHVESGTFVEHGEILGNEYGTALSEVQRVATEGKMCILDVDLAGAKTIKESESFPGALFILVKPASLEGLQAKLEERGVDNEAVVKQKMEIASAYMDREKEGAEDFAFDEEIVNADAAESLMELKFYISKHSENIIKPTSVPFVVCGPLGCGKHELVLRLFTNFADKFAAPVIYTTRENAGENSGYKYVPKPDFQRDITDGKFAFHEEVQGYLYGLPFASVEAVCKKGKVPIVDVDTVDQAKRLKEAGFESKYIFIGPESIQDVETKIRAELEHSPAAGYSVEEALRMRLDFVKKECHDSTMRVSGEPIFEKFVEVSKKEMLELEVEAHEQVGNVAYHKLLEYIANEVPEQISKPQVWGYGQQLWDTSVREYGKMQLKVIVLGPAGSGKTTQCALLSQKFQIPIISPGLLLYEEIKNKTEIGMKANKYMDATKTVPEDLIVTIIKKRISKPDCLLQGWIMDGFPHTTAEADALSRGGISADKVIFLQSRQDILLWRCRGRRIDPDNAHNIYFFPSTQDGAPDVLKYDEKAISATSIVPSKGTGEEDTDMTEKLTIRHDDTEENIRNRISLYDYYESGIKAEYHQVSQYIPGGDAESIRAQGAMQWHRLSPSGILDAIVDFLVLDDKYADEIELVESKKLAEWQYSIVDTLKFQQKSLVKLQQQTGPFPGKQFWAALEDICSNTVCINFNHYVAKQSHAMHINSQPESRQNSHLLHIKSEEPIRLTATLSLAPQYALEDSPDVCEPPKVPMLVVCGPSGVGKYTLIRMLVEGFDEKFTHVLRYTTRKEKMGAHVSRGFLHMDAEDMRKDIDKGLFAEHYEVEGELYGTYMDHLNDEANRMCILNIDIDGVKRLKGIPGHECIFVFITPPSIEALDRRLRDRGFDDEEHIQQKLALARADMAAAAQEDLFNHTLVNDDLSSTYRQLLDIASNHWPKSKNGASCNGAMGMFKFESHDKIKEYLKKMSCNIERTVVLDFVRGDYVLELGVDKNFAYSYSFTSTTPFDLKPDYELLKARDYNVIEAKGSYEDQEPGAWAIWFRRTLKVVNKRTLLTLRLHVSDNGMKPFVHLVVVNNDDGSSRRLYVTSDTDPIPFEPNSKGYNLVTFSRNNSAETLPGSTWHFVAFSDDVDLGIDECYSENTLTFSDAYKPNVNFLLCRYILNASEWTQVAFLASVSASAKATGNGGAGETGGAEGREGAEAEGSGGDDSAGSGADASDASLASSALRPDVTVSIVKATPAGDGEADLASGMTRKLFHFDVLRAWPSISLLTVPAFNLEPLAEGEGLYMLQMELNPTQCGFAFEANGEAGAEVDWQLMVNATSASLGIEKDESRDKYFESVLDIWNQAGDKRAQAALKVLEDYGAKEGAGGAGGEGEEATVVRKTSDGEEVVLSPMKHRKRIPADGSTPNAKGAAAATGAGTTRAGSGQGVGGGDGEGDGPSVVEIGVDVAEDGDGASGGGEFDAADYMAARAEERKAEHALRESARGAALSAFNTLRKRGMQNLSNTLKKKTAPQAEADDQAAGAEA